MRSFGALIDQTPDSNVARAILAARSTSSAWQEATWASTVPSIGLSQANVSPDAASALSPPMTARLGIEMVFSVSGTTGAFMATSLRKRGRPVGPVAQ